MKDWDHEGSIQQSDNSEGEAVPEFGDTFVQTSARWLRGEERMKGVTFPRQQSVDGVDRGWGEIGLRDGLGCSTTLSNFLLSWAKQLPNQVVMHPIKCFLWCIRTNWMESLETC